MRLLLCLFVPLIAAGCASPEASSPPESPPAAVSLFDGATFDGWEGNLEMFRIEGPSTGSGETGAIVGGTLEAPVPRNEFLCTTRRYDDFELRLAFRLLGEGVNAGVQFRSERIPGDHEVIGYQADLGDGWWGKLYDESRRRRVLAGPDSTAPAAPIRPGDWNDYVIRAEGRRVRLAVNGVETVDYTEPDTTLAQTGLVCLQIHSGGPSEAWYRDITIEEL